VNEFLNQVTITFNSSERLDIQRRRARLEAYHARDITLHLGAMGGNDPRVCQWNSFGPVLFYSLDVQRKNGLAAQGACNLASRRAAQLLRGIHLDLLLRRMVLTPLQPAAQPFVGCQPAWQAIAVGVIRLKHVQFIRRPEECINATSFRVCLARAGNGEEVANRRENDVRLRGESRDEVGVIKPVSEKWRQALLCILRPYAFKQSLPGSDVARRCGDTDPVVER